jgi:hypothetical protein
MMSHMRRKRNKLRESEKERVKKDHCQPEVTFPFEYVDVMEEEDTSRDLKECGSIKHTPITPKDHTECTHRELESRHTLRGRREIPADVSCGEGAKEICVLMWREERGGGGGGGGVLKEEREGEEKRREGKKFHFSVSSCQKKQKNFKV